MQRTPKRPFDRTLRFQSSPGLLAECNCPSGAILLVLPGFQSSPGLLAECNFSSTLRLAVLLEFQSSPGLLAECNLHVGNAHGHGVDAFQSSPGLLAECNGHIGSMVQPNIMLFQSSPGLLAECNDGDNPYKARHLPVSILTRPSGRMQPRDAFNKMEAFKFQSSPGLLAECNASRASIAEPPRTFQSSPGLLAECNPLLPDPVYRQDAVSILTRPSGRMQPRLAVPRHHCLHRDRFNPHPAFWPNATGASAATSPIGNGTFQSSPGLLAECNHVAPVRRQGLHRVSILTRPSGRMQPIGTRTTTSIRIVSILTRPSGRMQRPCRARRRSPPACFNPHPAFWPNATGQQCGHRQTQEGFNPHPAFWPNATCCRTCPLGECAGFNPHPAFWPNATPVSEFPICSALTS